MPIAAVATTQFDEAIARLRALSGPSTAHYIDNHALRCIDDARRIAALVPGGKVLNVGGRPYLFEYVAQGLQLDVDTVDIAPERDPAEIADLGITVMAADFETEAGRASLPLDDYDLICLAEIFEHMRQDLVGTFRSLALAMRPDARVYLTTPNFYFAPVLLRTLAGGRSGPSLVREWNKLHTVGHMGHVREYARAELVEFFRFAGFEVELSLVRNCRLADVRGGGLVQAPIRWLANVMARNFDRFGQELVFVLRPATRAATSPALG